MTGRTVGTRLAGWAGDGRRAVVGRCAAIALTAAFSCYLVVHHSKVWVGPMHPARAVVFLAVVGGAWLAHTLARVRDRRRFTTGLLLVPVLAALGVIGASTTRIADARWERSEAAFVTLDRALPPGWPTHASGVGGNVSVGSFQVSDIIRDRTGTYFSIDGRPSYTDCEGGIANLPHGPVGSDAPVTRHLDGPWYTFTACWD